MASDASHMLEAALEQMDDIIAGKQVNRLFRSYSSSSYQRSTACFTDLQLASCYFLALISGKGLDELNCPLGITLEPLDSALAFTGTLSTCLFGDCASGLQ